MLKSITSWKNFDVQSIPFWIITATLGSVIFFRRIVQEGLSMDGLTYASIGRNLAIGKGSFWKPYFSSSYWLPYQSGTVFYEHPPLWFWAESLFYKVLGDEIYVEKFVSTLVTIGIVALVVLIWNVYFEDSPATKHLGWLPILVLFSFRLTEWTFAQNLLDTPVTLMNLANIFVLILLAKGRLRLGIGATLAGLTVVVGLLIKGPFVLPVLAAPLALAAVGALGFDWKRAVWAVVIELGVVLVAALILYAFDPSRLFFETYLKQQVLASLANQRENIADSQEFGQLQQLYEFLLNVSPALIIGIGLHAYMRVSLIRKKMPQIQLAVWMLILSMCVLLPQLLLKKQINYYLIQLLPYAALGLASWLVVPINLVVEKRITAFPKTLSVVAWGSLVAGLIYLGSIFGEPYGSQQGHLHDLRAFAKYIKPAAKVCVCEDVMLDYQSHAYWQRYGRNEFRNVGSDCSVIMTFKGRSCTDSGRAMTTKLLNFKKLSIKSQVYDVLVRTAFQKMN